MYVVVRFFIWLSNKENIDSLLQAQLASNIRCFCTLIDGGKCACKYMRLSDLC
jgi:hypothetical protein